MFKYGCKNCNTMYEILPKYDIAEDENDPNILTCRHHCAYSEYYDGCLACMLDEFHPVEVKEGDKCLHNFIVINKHPGRKPTKGGIQ